MISKTVPANCREPCCLLDSFLQPCQPMNQAAPPPPSCGASAVISVLTASGVHSRSPPLTPIVTQEGQFLLLYCHGASLTLFALLSIPNKVGRILRATFCSEMDRGAIFQTGVRYKRRTQDSNILIFQTHWSCSRLSRVLKSTAFEGILPRSISLLYLFVRRPRTLL